jgi:isochorismate pyruvate lyase
MTNMEPIAPEQCRNLDEIRDCMDSLDKEIISLLARRLAYVRAAAKFKPSAESVAAPERVEKVLDTRRLWADQAGLDGDVIRSLYRDIVSYCVGEERKQWERSQRQS